MWWYCSLVVYVCSLIGSMGWPLLDVGGTGGY